MFDRLLDIINQTRKDESFDTFEEISLDLHTDVDFEDIDNLLQELNL